MNHLQVLLQLNEKYPMIENLPEKITKFEKYNIFIRHENSIEYSFFDKINSFRLQNKKI
jgi:hypothetical protein